MLSSPIKTNTELKSSRRFGHDATISRLKRKTLSSFPNPLRKGGKKNVQTARECCVLSPKQFCYAPFRVRFELAEQNQKWINRIPLIFKSTIKDFQNCLVASIDWLSALRRRLNESASEGKSCPRRRPRFPLSNARALGERRRFSLRC